MIAPTAVALLAAFAPQSEPKAPAATTSKPREVTLETLGDAKALAALQRPGEEIFEDGFESDASLDKYFEIRGRDDGRARRIDDPKLANRGSGALQLTAPDRDGKASGSGASCWLGKDGYDRIYFRRYIRFPADYDQGNLHHVGGGLTGVGGTGKWDEMGKAGIKPAGDDNFKSSFEPWRDWGREEAPGYMFLYTYWVDMERGRDGNYWGNMLGTTEDRRVVPSRDEWVCLEQMIQVNTIGEADGEFAAWINGELYTHWTGMRWRTAEKVRIKRFSLGLYVHHAERDNTVWYDDVVVSTGYVGTVEQRQARLRALEDGPEKRR